METVFWPSKGDMGREIRSYLPASYYVRSPECYQQQWGIPVHGKRSPSEKHQHFCSLSLGLETKRTCGIIFSVSRGLRDRGTEGGKGDKMLSCLPLYFLPRCPFTLGKMTHTGQVKLISRSLGF
jgi:hypothetical protein